MSDPAREYEEEVSLSGHGPSQPRIKDEAATAAPAAGAPVIQRRGADLSELGRVADPDEFVDRLIQASTDKLIPWEEVELPSRGLYYGWEHGFIKVRPMGQVAEKVLATQRLAQTGQSIDYLFQECAIMQDGMDPADLLIGDRTFLLYYLRGITHGNKYEFMVTCPRPDCQAASTHVYDLNELAQTLRWADPSLGGEPFRVRLPYLSEATKRDVTVGLRFLRGRDLHLMMATHRAKRKVIGNSTVRPGRQRRQRPDEQQPAQRIILDETITENLELAIQDFMGVTDRLKIQALVPKLHSNDTTAIREWLRDHTPGLDTFIRLDCQGCGQEFQIDLPLTETFFRPSEG